jgi:hypothetical protein
MGRPKLLGEKKIVCSVSYSIEDKEFLESRGISLSKIVQDAILRMRTDVGQNPKTAEFDSDIEKVRVIFVKTERGLLPKDAYWKAIAVFMEKWKDVTKPEVIGRVERQRYYAEPKEDGGESDG